MDHIVKTLTSGFQPVFPVREVTEIDPKDFKKGFYTTRHCFVPKYHLINEKTRISGFSPVFPVQQISESDPIDSDWVFIESREKMVPKYSRFHGKKANFRFRGSDRKWKSTPCNRPGQVGYTPKVSCKSVHPSRRR